MTLPSALLASFTLRLVLFLLSSSYFFLLLPSNHHYLANQLILLTLILPNLLCHTHNHTDRSFNVTTQLYIHYPTSPLLSPTTLLSYGLQTQAVTSRQYY